jgi:hypothetical protein
MTQMPPHGVTSVPLRRPIGPHNLPAVRKGRPLTAVALLTLAAAGAGCSGHPESAAQTERGTSAVPTTVSSTLNTASTTSGARGAPGTTTGTALKFSADEQAVIDAYDEANRAYQRAASASNPSDPAFKAAFSAQFLHELQIRIQQRTDNGQAVRDAQPSQAQTSFIAVTVTPPTATITTCEVDDRVVYRIADGTAVNTKVTTARWTVAMSNEDGTWKVAGRQQAQTWDGEELDACRGVQQS